MERNLHVGDHVFLEADYCSYIGVIDFISSNKNSKISCYWMYHPEEVDASYQYQLLPNELFFSFHSDINPRGCVIEEKPTILFVDEKDEESVGFAVDYVTNHDKVYLCRYVYDLENMIVVPLKSKTFSKEEQSFIENQLDKSLRFINNIRDTKSSKTAKRRSVLLDSSDEDEREIRKKVPSRESSEDESEGPIISKFNRKISAMSDSQNFDALRDTPEDLRRQGSVTVVARHWAEKEKKSHSAEDEVDSCGSDKDEFLTQIDSPHNLKQIRKGSEANSSEEEESHSRKNRPKKSRIHQPEKSRTHQPENQDNLVSDAKDLRRSTRKKTSKKDIAARKLLEAKQETERMLKRVSGHEKSGDSDYEDKPIAHTRKIRAWKSEKEDDYYGSGLSDFIVNSESEDENDEDDGNDGNDGKRAKNVASSLHPLVEDAEMGLLPDAIKNNPYLPPPPLRSACSISDAFFVFVAWIACCRACPKLAKLLSKHSSNPFFAYFIDSCRRVSRALRSRCDSLLSSMLWKPGLKEQLRCLPIAKSERLVFSSVSSAKSSRIPENGIELDPLIRKQWLHCDACNRNNPASWKLTLSGTPYDSENLWRECEVQPILLDPEQVFGDPEKQVVVLYLGSLCHRRLKLYSHLTHFKLRVVRHVDTMISSCSTIPQNWDEIVAMINGRFEKQSTASVKRQRTWADLNERFNMLIHEADSKFSSEHGDDAVEIFSDDLLADLPSPIAPPAPVDLDVDVDVDIDPCLQPKEPSQKSKKKRKKRKHSCSDSVSEQNHENHEQVRIMDQSLPKKKKSKRVQEEHQTVYLFCPISRVRIHIPVRGEKCMHLQVMDKGSLLQQCESSEGTIACPIKGCNQILSANSLIIAEDAISVLSLTQPDTTFVTCTKAIQSKSGLQMEEWIEPTKDALLGRIKEAYPWEWEIGNKEEVVVE